MTEQDPAERAPSEDPAFYEALGRAIKVERTARGVERKELAERAGLSYPYLSEIENGSKRASSRALMAIARALELQPSDLLRMAESWSEDAEASATSASSSAYEQVLNLRHARMPEALALREPTFDEPTRRRSSWFRAEPAAVPASPSGREELLAEIARLLRELSDEDLRRLRDLATRLMR